MSTPSKDDAKMMVVGKTQPIEKSYKLGKQLGQAGQFGRAFLAVSKKDGTKRAVKVISKAKFRGLHDRQQHFKQLRDEIRIMNAMSHPNIIKFSEVFEDRTKLYIVMECCTGGELFDRIRAQPKGSYTEAKASLVLKQIAEGIKYMHANKIAHCDLKPDNFLFAHEAEDAPLKIIDFGMSKLVIQNTAPGKRRKYLTSFRGTPYYVAPEVLNAKYVEHSDMWSFGVIMFVMLFGYPPFSGDSDEVIFRKIKKGFKCEVKRGYGSHFPAKMPVSESARDLIGKCLMMDQAKRYTAAEALEHPWLSGKASQEPLDLIVIKNLAEFTGKCKLKAACVDLFSTVMTEDEIEALKETFRKIDANGDGSITLDELRQAVKNGGIDESKVKVEDLMKMADMDGDGVLSYDELLLTSIQRKMKNKEERMWEAFSMLDVDGDGFVTAAEIESVLGTEDAKAMLAEVDKNGDGRVDYDEFMAMWETQHADV